MHSLETIVYRNARAVVTAAIVSALSGDTERTLAIQRANPDLFLDPDTDDYSAVVPEWDEGGEG